jgi:hypothetical protein
VAHSTLALDIMPRRCAVVITPPSCRLNACQYGGFLGESGGQTEVLSCPSFSYN